jgi:tetratricopeptide (TPR) repeat protein
VEAERVASLLAEHRVPVAVLNACQSAMQDASEASLAQRLAEAGVPVAMGMAYSVTVSAAERVMPELYGRIAERYELTGAMRAARRELYDHKARRAYFSQQLDLEDWMLPVMFAQQPLHIQLRPMTSPEQAVFYARAAAVGDAPVTEYGFVGRDLDIQAIEHRLLTDQTCNELLIQGMAGAGKTTMLFHLAWWWQRTGLVHEVFRFSYEDRAWTSGQIIREIRSRLFTAEECARAETMPEAAQAEQLAQRLRSDRHLLILDNAESITATPASIPHALSADEQQGLKLLLSRLLGGRTLVLLGSRETEAWLTSSISGPGIYRLSGLDPQAASILVERILDRHGAARYLVDEVEHAALQDLVTLLGGYPLALTVVLPVLESSRPSMVLAELRRGGPDADPANLIYSAIEYSHGKLDPKLQNSLQLLAPFTGTISTGPILDGYQRFLLVDESVRELGPIDISASLKQAVSVGLAAPHPQFKSSMVQVQPILPYFLRSRLRDRPLIRDAADRAHYRLYCELALQFLRLLTSGKDPARRKAGLAASQAEYANLTAALDYGLHTGRPVITLILSLDEYLMMSRQHVARRRLLDETIAKYPAPATNEAKFELERLHMRTGIAAFDRNSFAEAKEHLESALKLGKAIEDEAGIALSHHELGMVATKQRRFDEAESHFRQSIELSLRAGDQINTALTYFQLGIMSTDRWKLADAEKAYQNALKIFLELDQLWHVARCHHELGIVAQAQGRLSEAEKSFRYSIEVKLKFGDVLGTAVSYNQLAMGQARGGRYTEAEDSCRRAIQIWFEFGERLSAASAYNQIGTMAFNRQRYSEAAANYDKALRLNLEFGIQHEAAVVYTNLGILAGHQRQYEEAELNFRKAVESYGDTDPRATARVMTRLGVLLAEAGRHKDAIAVLLDAAVIWRQEVGSWDGGSLPLLHRERTLLAQNDFAAQMAEHVPPALAHELTAAIDAASDPEAGDDRQTINV